MFILVATEHFYRLRKPQHAPAIAAPPAPHRAVATQRVVAAVSPLDPATAGAPQGTRYQLFRALRAMADGEAMVVERRIPSLAGHFENVEKREAWFRQLRSAASWEGDSAVEPVLVPGTAYPGVIGRIMLRAGWCAPSAQPHWVPNLRFFFLTEIGYRSFEGARAWWSERTAIERMRLMVLE